MRQPKGCQLHRDQANRRRTPDLTGDADFDHAIMKCVNKDMPDRLELHIMGGKSYGPRTSYRAYSGKAYRGDD